MNRPCTGCGRIITIPDIPLPEGYTQKCTACGLSNLLSDDNTATIPLPLPLPPPPPEHSWDNSQGFDTTSDSLANSLVHVETPIGSTEEQLLWRFEQKLLDLETRLRGELGDGPLDATLPHDKKSTATATSSPVKQTELLIGTQNVPLYKNCETLLKSKGYTIHIATRLNMALSMILQNPYEVLLLDQAFLSSGEEGRKIFKHIKQTPLEVRRWQTVVLITPGIATGEPQVFYQWGIDFNIHPRDLDSLDEHLASLKQLKSELLEPYLA